LSVPPAPDGYHFFMPAPAPRRYRLTADQRLRGQSAFKHVFDANVRKNQGPITVVGVPNETQRVKFGISIGRRVGIAVKRNRIKRLLREAFRLTQHDWPRGYDLVCLVRPHDPLRLAEYQRLLFSAIRSLHLEWERRGRRQNQQTSKATNQQTEKSEGKSG